MAAPRSPRPLNNLTCIGFCLLAAASLLYYLVGHELVPRNDLTDLVGGLLYGMCFASLLLGVRRSSQQQSAGSCRGE